MQTLRTSKLYAMTGAVHSLSENAFVAITGLLDSMRLGTTPFQMHASEGAEDAAKSLNRWLEFHCDGCGCGDERGIVTEFRELHQPALRPLFVATDEEIKAVADFLRESRGVHTIMEHTD